MASQIINWGVENDKAVQMINSHFARSFSIGSNWQKIRVATRISGADPLVGVHLTGTPRLFIGLSHSTSSVFGDSLVEHAVGVIQTESTATWSTPYYMWGFTPCCKTGSILTTFGSSATTFLFSTASVVSASSTRTLLFVDLERNAPNTYLTCSLVYNNNGTTPDFTQTQFFYYGEQTGNPGANMHAYTTLGYIPITEAGNGTLDSINISWDRTVPKLIVSDIAIYKFA
jgi:hypothetical protein